MPLASRYRRSGAGRRFGGSAYGAPGEFVASSAGQAQGLVRPPGYASPFETPTYPYDPNAPWNGGVRDGRFVPRWPTADKIENTLLAQGYAFRGPTQDGKGAIFWNPSTGQAVQFDPVTGTTAPQGPQMGTFPGATTPGAAPGATPPPPVQGELIGSGTSPQGPVQFYRMPDGSIRTVVAGKVTGTTAPATAAPATQPPPQQAPVPGSTFMPSPVAPQPVVPMGQQPPPTYGDTTPPPAGTENFTADPTKQPLVGAPTDPAQYGDFSGTGGGVPKMLQPQMPVPNPANTAAVDPTGGGAYIDPGAVGGPEQRFTGRYTDYTQTPPATYTGNRADTSWDAQSALNQSAIDQMPVQQRPEYYRPPTSYEQPMVDAGMTGGAMQPPPYEMQQPMQQPDLQPLAPMPMAPPSTFGGTDSMSMPESPFGSYFDDLAMAPPPDYFEQAFVAEPFREMNANSDSLFA